MANDIVKILKNNTQNPITYYGVKITPNNQYTIPSSEIDGFLNDSNLQSDITNSIVIVNNGTSNLASNEGWNWLNTFYLDTSGVLQGKGVLTFQSARNGTIGSGSYLYSEDGIAMDSNVGWVAPWNGNIIAISIGRNNTSPAVVEIRKNGESTSAQLSTSANKSYVNNLTVAFSAGDSLAVYVKEGTLQRPLVTVFCTWN